MLKNKSKKKSSGSTKRLYRWLLLRHILANHLDWSNLVSSGVDVQPAHHHGAEKLCRRSQSCLFWSASVYACEISPHFLYRYTLKRKKKGGKKNPTWFSLPLSKLPLLASDTRWRQPREAGRGVILLWGAEGHNLLLTDTLLSDESSGAQMICGGELSLRAW